MRAILKALAWTFSIVGLGIAAVFGYVAYDEWRTDAIALAFDVKPDGEPWRWHSDWPPIQISETPGKVAILRRVYPQDNHAIYASVSSNYQLLAVGVWLIDCTPGAEIATSKTWADGSPKILECAESGDRLSIGVSIPTLRGSWVEDFDGFKVAEDFSYWDFQPLVQQVTIGKAAAPAPEIAEAPPP